MKIITAQLIVKKHFVLASKFIKADQKNVLDELNKSLNFTKKELNKLKIPFKIKDLNTSLSKGLSTTYLIFDYGKDTPEINMGPVASKNFGNTQVNIFKMSNEPKMPVQLNVPLEDLAALFPNVVKKKEAFEKLLKVFDTKGKIDIEDIEKIAPAQDETSRIEKIDEIAAALEGWVNNDVWNNMKPYAKKLVKLQKYIPSKYKKTSGDLYRIVAIDKKSLETLKQGKKLDLEKRSVSSWTPKLSKAKQFLKVMKLKSDQIPIILQRDFPDKAVVVNIGNIGKLLVDGGYSILADFIKQEKEVLIDGQFTKTIEPKHVSLIKDGRKWENF